MAQPKGNLHLIERFKTNVQKQGNTFQPHAVTPQVAAEQVLDPFTDLGEYEEIWADVDLIDDNPYQPRLSMDNETQGELVEQMNQDGQLQAGGVRPHPTKKGRWQMIWAHRRKYAVKNGYLKPSKTGGPPEQIYANAGTGLPEAEQYIGKLRVRVYKQVSDLKMRRMAFSENDSRVDLKPMEVALFYKSTMDDLTKEGRANGTIGRDLKGEWKSATYKDVAIFLNKKLAGVHRMIRLLELPDPMKKYIEAGDMNERHGRAALKLAPWPEHQAAFIRDMKKSGIGGAAAEREADRRVGILADKLPNQAHNEQVRQDAQIARSEFTFDPDSEREAMARRAEIASVMQSPEEKAAAALGATLDAAVALGDALSAPPPTDKDEEVEGIVKNLDLIVTAAAIDDGTIDELEAERAKASASPPTITVTQEAKEQLASSFGELNSAIEELGRRRELEQSVELGLEKVEESFGHDHVQVTAQAVSETGTNGVVQIPRLTQTTFDNMQEAGNNLKWASMGFDVMAVTPEDLQEFEKLMSVADKYMAALHASLKRHKQPGESS